jgi:multidrug efflux pump subunit AcrA (membrane-fusion protein)
MASTKLVLLAAVLSLLVACSKSEKQAGPVVSVQVAPVVQGSIEKVISAEVVLFPLQQAAITSKISAPVKQFYVNRGSKVKAGQLLATLENRDLNASQIENKGALAQAEAAYATTTVADVPEEMHKAELDVESSEQALAAEQKLFDSRQDLYQQGALPRKDMDQARVSLAQAKSQYEIAQQHWDALQAIGKEQELKSASGQLESARGKYLGSEAQLSYSQIRSPINGVIAERAWYPGEMAAAGTPLLIVMDTSAIIAKAHIPQQDAALLKIGNSAELTAPGIDEPIPAKITVISPATDANSTTVEIWAKATNKKNRLRPGTTARLSITAQKIDNTLTVPSSAIVKQPEGESTGLMVVNASNHAHFQAVQTGIESGNDMQILSGVKAGERVVTGGAYHLPDNAEVKIEQPTEPDKSEPATSNPGKGASD